MSETSLNLTTSPEVDSLIAQVKSIEAKLSENQKVLTRKIDYILCPVCQEGYLYPTKRGRILGVIDPDENALMIIQENKKPSILKLQTTFISHISGIEVPFSINLDNVIDIIRPSAD